MGKIAGRVCSKCGKVSYCPPAEEKEFHKAWAEIVVSRPGVFRHQFDLPLDICPDCLKPVLDTIGK